MPSSEIVLGRSRTVTARLGVHAGACHLSPHLVGSDGPDEAKHDGTRQKPFPRHALRAIGPCYGIVHVRTMRPREPMADQNYD